MGSIVVPFCGCYLGSHKVIPKKELPWSLWVSWGFHKGEGEVPSMKKKREHPFRRSRNFRDPSCPKGLGFRDVGV